MKTVIRALLVLFLFIFLHDNAMSITNNINQCTYRWRNDDGDASTATWAAVESAAVTVNNTNNIRLRVGIYTSGGEHSWNLGVSLYYSTSQSGPWTQITNSASNAFVINSSSNFSDNTSSSYYLSGCSGTCSGSESKVFDETYYYSIPTASCNNFKFEYEWCIRPTVNASTNTYYFKYRRFEFADWYDMNGYDALPRMNYTASAEAPTVTTASISNIFSYSASGGGNVTDDGGATITARGVCWNTASNPTTSNSHTSESGTTGAFTSSITGLIPNTTYHVRAYATNSEDTSYGDDVSFTTAEITPAMTEWALIILGVVALVFGVRFVVKMS